MRVALVHDYLNQYGGAERVLQVLCELFPQAPIYTLLYDARATGFVFHKRTIVTSFLQHVPLAKRYHRFFPVLMPLAIEQFDFSNFDLVISSSPAFAKGIITKPATRHINYCHTPTRFLWDDSQRYISEFSSNWLIKVLAPLLITYLRIWDRQAAMRPDRLVAISQHVAERIKRYYHSASEIIYPPVDCQKFSIAPKIDDYFLMVGRLVSYKRFDLAIQAFNAMGQPLWIVGDGPEYKRLRAMAGPTIRFLSAVPDRLLAPIYSHAQALIFPQEEDFGIVALEAMAAGRPVIAYDAGGARETVIHGKTGILFDSQTEIALAQALGEYRYTRFDPQIIREHALRFDRSIFKEQMKAYIDRIGK